MSTAYKELPRAVMACSYAESTVNPGSDLIMLKERVATEDGGTKSNIKLIRDFQRPFYIHKKQHRNYGSHREFAEQHELDMFTSNQANLGRAINKALGVYSKRGDVYNAKASPFVYGADVVPESLIKHRYASKWPMFKPSPRIAVLDFETNVSSKKGEIISGSLTSKDVAYYVTSKTLSKKHTDDEIRKAITEEIGEELKERGCNLTIDIVENDYEVCKKLMMYAHQLSPDIMAIWNMSFDINKMLASCQRHNKKPEDLFCDPRVPQEFRRFKWREGKLKKITATGKVTTKHMADLWHVVETMCGFSFIDAMCLFKQLRPAKKMESSYSLDTVAGKYANVRKLHYEKTAHLTRTDWHREMQTKHPLVYAAYNVWDCIMMEILDETTGDMSRSFLTTLDTSPVSEFASGPRSLATAMHFYLLDKRRVLGSTPASLVEEFDKLSPDMTGWIVTLTSKLIGREGIQICNDVYLPKSRIYTHNVDVDVTSGYPNSGIVGNISKDTRRLEVFKVGNMNEYRRKRWGVNFTAMRTNAVELAREAFELPDADTLDNNFKAFLAETDSIRQAA